MNRGTQRVFKLGTSGVSLFEEFNLPVTRCALVGYLCSNMGLFRVPDSRAGLVPDGAVRNKTTHTTDVW